MIQPDMLDTLARAGVDEMSGPDRDCFHEGPKCNRRVPSYAAEYVYFRAMRQGRISRDTPPDEQKHDIAVLVSRMPVFFDPGVVSKKHGRNDKRAAK